MRIDIIINADADPELFVVQSMAQWVGECAAYEYQLMVDGLDAEIRELQLPGEGRIPEGRIILEGRISTTARAEVLALGWVNGITELTLRQVDSMCPLPEGYRLIEIDPAEINEDEDFAAWESSDPEMARCLCVAVYGHDEYMVAEDEQDPDLIPDEDTPGAILDGNGNGWPAIYCPGSSPVYVALVNDNFAA